MSTSHTNKLLAVTPGGGGELDKRFPAVSYQHFEYDAEGNMTKDNSKDMSIAYDWRGMPVEFKRFRCTTKGSTVCDSVKLVMAYAEAAGGLARISGGYELGLFGMEGRGVYAGGTVAGLHGEWSHRDGSSWGFEERGYYGIGNNTKIDGSAASIVRQELWFPTLGRFGYLTFGTSYDVSNRAEKELLLDYINNVYGLPVDENVFYNEEAFDKLISELSNMEGMTVDIVLPGKLANSAHGNGSKYTFSRPGEGRGHVELIKDKQWIKEKNKYRYGYSSFNHGANLFTHYFIDYRGWKGRGY